MRFGPIPIAEAAGAILAHGIRREAITFKKGRVLSVEDCATLAALGLESVIAARLSSDDVPEDRAAAELAAALTGPGLRATAPFTGRVNLIAETSGLLIVPRATIDAVNAIDEALTVATLAEHEQVARGMMAATIKIIPFALSRESLARAAAVVQALGACHVAPFAPKRVALIQTMLPGQKPKLFDATTATTVARLTPLGASLIDERRCSHDETALTAALASLPACDLVLIAGASAVVDRRDVIPAAIEAAGGLVEHFGMPVDPGNLLLIGALGGRPVIGLPGCARSPKLNGFDWVLQRLCADLPVGRREIAGMGVGGLLKEIPTRPQPRDGVAAPLPGPRAARIAGIVLAAGRSTRMGSNKLLLPVEGQPMVARTVDRLLAASIGELIVVVGHQAEAVRAALGDRPVRYVVNPAYAEGLASSVKAGIDSLPESCDGALVALGDMPLVDTADIDRLIAAFDPVEGRAICVPTHHTKRGNPILWGRQLFAEMAQLSGDVGAKGLLARHAELVAEVAMERPGVLIDVDTPSAFERVVAGDLTLSGVD